MTSAAAVLEDWEAIDSELRVNFSEELGRGGYGSVYKGEYVLPSNSSTLLRWFAGRKNKIDVAVKRIDPKNVKLEDEILAKVGNHRNVLHFYCAKKKRGFCFLVTELCNGTLADLVKGRHDGPPVRDNWAPIVRQIVVGLRFLHANGVIHRNLEPRNILFTIDDTKRPVMKLTDFGISRILKEDQSHLTRSKTKDDSGYTILRPFDTDGWIAPEILKGERTYKESVDIFPLGLVIAFTLSGGLHPFDVDPPNDEETNEEKIQRIKKRNGRIRKGEPMTLTVDQLKEDDRLAFDLIQSMLNPNPNERPSANEVLEHEYFQLVPKVVDQKFTIFK